MKLQSRAAAIALSATLCACASFAATPIGWWSMDSLDADGKIPDLSGNNRPLTLFGNVCLTNDAVSGMALCNPGNAYGSCAKFMCPGGIKARSVSMWVKLEGDDGTYAQTKPDGSTANNSYPHLFSNFSNMRLIWSYNATGPGSTLYAGSTLVGASFVKPRGTWSHVVVTVGNVAADESTADFTVYQDGVMITSTNNFALSSNWRTAGATSACLAGNGAERTIRGVIDEVKAYDVALTPLEVQEEFERFSNPCSAFGHWTMEDAYVDGGKVYVNDAFGRQTLQLQGGAVLTNADHWTSQAIYFDGTRSTCAFTDAKRVAQSLTFAAWIYIPNDRIPADILSGNSYPRMFTTSNGTKAYPSASKTEYNMTAYFGDSSYVSGVSVLASKTHWTHVALVYDVGRDADGLYYVARFYRNGLKVAVGAKKYVAERTGGIVLSSKGGVDTVRLGGDGSTRPFYGYMDDVWMFCRALDDAEVRQLYCGVSPVSAGEDFTVAAPAATLEGLRNPAADFVPSIGEFGTTAWSLVSAPEGGEGAVLAAPGQLVTEVTLPVEGAYVFRLTNTGEFGALSDEVTVTRVSGEPSVPSLTLSAASADVAMPEPAYLAAATGAPAPRYFWSKKSGPGGVYFSDATAAKSEAVFTAAGEYVLSCTVESGGASASADIAVSVTGAADCTVPGAERGLVAYWNFDSAPLEELSQARYVLYNAAQPMMSKVGMGIGVPPQTATAKAYITSVTLPAAEAGTAMFWMYDDSANQYVDDKYSRVWIGGQFEVQYENNKGGAESSLTVYVNHAAGQDTFGVPIPVDRLRNGSRKGRWSHCAVVFDYSAYTNTPAAYATDSLNRLRVYVDGDEFAPASCKTSATNATGTTVMIAPKTANTSPSAFLGNNSNNRYFPGRLDELRYYTNALTQAEIRRLAWEFAPHNRAPIVEAPAALKAVARCAVPLDAAVYDDGTATLSSSWKVVGGEAANVAFADAESPATDVTFKKAGTYVLQLVASDGELEAKSRELVCEVVPKGLYLMVY